METISLTSQRAWVFPIWVAMSYLKSREHEVVTEDTIEDYEINILLKIIASILLKDRKFGIAMRLSVYSFIALNREHPENDEMI